MLKRLLTLGTALLAVSACGDTAVEPGMDAPRPTTAAFARAAQVSLCHLDKDLRTYFLIRINGNAESAHLAHGDGRVWDPYPGLPHEVFDPDCAPISKDFVPVGTITADINRGGSPPGVDRGVESPAGNLVADAQLWATLGNGAQIAFMNPGGVRSDLIYAQSGTEGDGVVTYGEAFTFQPFGNRLLTAPMTGAQIVQVLSEQCQPVVAGRPFLHLGVSAGLTYDLSRTTVGGECTAVSVTNVRLNGVLLDPAQTYGVTVNDFLAGGGDAFATFATVAGPWIDGGSDLAALVAYLGAFSPVAPPPTNRVNELN